MIEIVRTIAVFAVGLAVGLAIGFHVDNRMRLTEWSR